MDSIKHIVKNVLKGDLSPHEGERKLAFILDKVKSNKQIKKVYSKGTCALRVCRSLKETSKNDNAWQDFAVNLRQYILTTREKVFVNRIIAEKLTKIRTKFQIYVEADNCVTAFCDKFPDWLQQYKVALNELYIYEHNEDQEQPIGDGILYKMSNSPYYLSQSQKTIVHAALNMPSGSSLLACLPTGGGKSLVSLMPAFFYTEGGQLSGAHEKSGITLVVVPTVSLALDQFESANKYFKSAIDDDHKPKAFRGDSTPEEKKKIIDGVRKGNIPILYTSPEAILNNPQFFHAILESARNNRMNYLVIDEAHIVQDWGASFRPEFQFLSPFRKNLLRESKGRIKTILLTATLNKRATDLLKLLFSEEDKFIELRGDTLRAEPMFLFDSSNSEDTRREKIVEALPLLPRPIILYVTQPKIARQWESIIKESGFYSVSNFTGETDGKDGQIVLTKWNNNEIDIMVATSAFGLGVDKPDIRAIIHCCLPQSINRFYQEVGRGGRDGFPSISILSFVKGIDESEGQGMINKYPLTVNNMVERWQSMRSNPIGGLAGDQLWVSVDQKPPHLANGITGEPNSNFNEEVLLFLYKMNLIQILETKPRDKDHRRLVLIKMNNLDIICDTQELTARMEPIRHALRSSITQEFDDMKSLANKPLQACWGYVLQKVYPYTDQFCKGCPKCFKDNHEHMGYYPNTKLTVQGKNFYKRSETTLSYLGDEKSIFFYYTGSYDYSGNDFVELINYLIRGNVQHIVLPEKVLTNLERVLSNIITTNCLPYLLYEIDEFIDMYENDNLLLYSHTIAVFYSDNINLRDKCYVKLQQISNDYNVQVIHISDYETYITSENKKLHNLIGLQYNSRDLIKKDEQDIEEIL